ncbi:hypothetical protein [Maribacter polysaccharolyticus]|uniref:hypothetical protein n=1 Tax=Maribacter polysaccharolyticus TaxID=3020831 RepID=UPI00237F67AC|nr:hypothetical protein [Maribacter polysaccharolyticus]MDE3744085.1 hypothetical protein [Maribacter polysaccharolyticus]
MTCKVANEISLKILLESWGYHKIKNHRGGDQSFYENPIREDSKPSLAHIHVHLYEVTKPLS